MSLFKNWFDLFKELFMFNDLLFSIFLDSKFLDLCFSSSKRLFTFIALFLKFFLLSSLINFLLLFLILDIIIWFIILWLPFNLFKLINDILDLSLFSKTSPANPLLVADILICWVSFLIKYSANLNKGNILEKSRNIFL